MSRFDGSDEELTLGGALVEMATRIAWQTEEMQNEVIRAIRAEFGIEVPEPDHSANVADSRDLTLRQQDDEIAALRKKLERADLEKELAVREAEIRAANASHPVTADQVADVADAAGVGTDSTDPGDTAVTRTPGKRVR